MTRRLEGATDDLYEPGSDACHLALRQLWDVFDHLGFKVVKKSASETTLSVYPERIHQYPLLNPRFEAHAEEWGTDLEGDCLVITALAKEPDPVLNEHLKTFNHDEGEFIFDGDPPGCTTSSGASSFRCTAPRQWRARRSISFVWVAP